MLKISIIITTYKHQDYIKETIESILSQSFTNWELLIGDDSPDEKTWNIIQEYVNKYPNKIKAWHHKMNKGIVGNLNFLISKCNVDSKYVTFLEGDDLFTFDNLENKIKVFLMYPELGMIYNNLDFIDSKGDIIYKNILSKAPYYLKNELISKESFLNHETFYLSYSTLMIKKDILNKEKIINPTNDKLYTVSDWDLFFRISNKYNCYGIEESLTLYRRHPGNLSGQYLKLFSDLEIQINEYKKSGFINNQLFNYKLSFINILRSVACIEKLDRKNSFKFLFKSFENSFMSNIHYKIVIFILNILPGFLIKFILKKINKR